MPDQKQIQQLDLNLLKVFECMYREQNMTRVAESMFITPSAVSHAIKRLRDTLGDPLFVRKGQSMQPTPACRRMAPLLQDGLVRLRQALQQCSEFTPATTEQVFRLSIHDALEPLVVPRLLQLFAKQAPNAGINSIKLDRDNTGRQLTSGQIDAAIDVALPLRAPIRHCRLACDPLCVLMHRDHPLQGELNQQQYLSAGHIAVSNRPAGRVMEDIALQQQGLTRLIKTRCQSYHTAREIVRNSQLLLTLPSLLATQLLDEELVMRSLPGSMPELETHLYWHESAEEDSSLSWFRDQLALAFRQIGKDSC